MTYLPLRIGFLQALSFSQLSESFTAPGLSQQSPASPALCVMALLFAFGLFSHLYFPLNVALEHLPSAVATRTPPPGRWLQQCGVSGLPLI